MSFFHYKDTIGEGDLVLAFVSRSTIKPIRVQKGAQLNTRYGNFEHDKMIGMRYGDQMGGSKGYGFIHLIHPTPEMWTLSLPHRTQIVYTHDSSYIMQRLGVQAGSRVIEAGTGSASFTHSFARTLGREGRLFTYEFHEPRYLEAKAELEDHELTNTVITHRDVCADGFEIRELPEGFERNGGIDGEVVFLDLPAPWSAIPNLPSVVSRTKRVGICCFSPCIEQVDKTVKALQDHGWVDIEMVEVAGRRWEARKEMKRTLDDVVKRLKSIKQRRAESTEHFKSMKRAAEDDGVLPDTVKLPKLDQLHEESPGVEHTPEYNPFGRGLRIREGDAGFDWVNVTKIEGDIKTHTSYLTFAYLMPRGAEGGKRGAEEEKEAKGKKRS